MRTAALAIALLLSGAAVAQTTTTTTEPDIDVDADVGIQPDGDLDIDADVDVDTRTVVTTPVATTHHATTHMAMAPAGGAIVQPGNADPEHDARGIAVISDPALVPAGFNGVSGTALGGPLVDPATGATVDTDASYPACTATVTDNCVQTYERGRPS